MVLSEGARSMRISRGADRTGQVLGPGAGRMTQWRWERNLFAGVVAVSSLVLVSVVAAGIAAGKARSGGRGLG